MSPPIEPDTFGVLDATEEMDSPVNVAPLRAAIPPKARPTKPIVPPAPILVPPSTTASRTYELPLKRLAKPAANPVAAAPVPVAELPPRNTLPALLAPPATPVITRAAISSSMPIPEPVWATFSPIAAR